MTVRFAEEEVEERPSIQAEQLWVPEKQSPPPRTFTPETTTTTTTATTAALEGSQANSRSYKFPSTTTTNSHQSNHLLLPTSSSSSSLYHHHHYPHPHPHPHPTNTARAISPIRRPSSTIGLEFHPKLNLRRRPTLSHDGSSSRLHSTIRATTTAPLDHPATQPLPHAHHPTRHLASLDLRANRPRTSSSDLTTLKPTISSSLQPATSTTGSSSNAPLLHHHPHPPLGLRTRSSSASLRPRTHSLSLHESSIANPPSSLIPASSHHLINPSSRGGQPANSASHPPRPRSWVIPLNTHHHPSPRPPPASLGSIKKSLVETIDRFPCSLREKLILLTRLHAEVKAELTQLDDLFGHTLSSDPHEFDHERYLPARRRPSQSRLEEDLDQAIRLIGKVNY